MDLQVRTAPTPHSCRRGLCRLGLLPGCLSPAIGLELAPPAGHGLEGVVRVPSARHEGGGRHWAGCGAAAGCCCQAGGCPGPGLLRCRGSAAACELRPGTFGVTPGPLAVHLQAQVGGNQPRSRDGRSTASESGRLTV